MWILYMNKMYNTNVYHRNVHTNMNYASGFIMGITRNFSKPLVEHTKCRFTTPSYWPSSLLKILSGYPLMLFSYAKVYKHGREFLIPCTLQKSLHRAI